MLKPYKDWLTREIWMGDAIHPTNPYLVLTFREGSWQIYHAITGKPFLNVRIQKKEDAEALGLKLHEWYNDYLWIWDDKEWCGKDIPMLVQYTIPNGQQINDAIRWMEQQILVTDLKCIEGL